MFSRTRLVLAVAGALLAATLAGVASVALAGGGPTTTPTGSQTSGSGDGLAYVVNVTGIGTATATPDVADITLGVQTIRPDAGAAISENTQLMTAVMAVLKEMGIAGGDIQTVNYSMWVEQVYDRDGPTGEFRYQVENQVRIRLRDISKTGDVLQQALEAGANSVGGISFSASDTAALQSEARDEAVDNARAKAEQLAARLGVTLGDVRSVTEVSGYAPEAALMAVGIGGGGAVPISGGELTVTQTIQVVFDIAH